LAAVFEHNRLDLLSLAALTAIAAGMAVEGPAGAPSPHEALAMGQIYVRLGRWDEADACFVRAAGLGAAPWDARAVDREIRADALRQLALERRRRHRYEAAADAWRQLLEAGAGPAPTQEARRALAIHHEHRVRNLEEARRHAEGALASEQDPDEAEALRHRIARLDRKLGRG
jgi:tetratricopeptide (TPR) repeat protein